MSISYNKLWKKLIDNDMTKTDLRLKADIGTSTLAKLGKNEQVSMDVLLRICKVLNCDISEIMAKLQPYFIKNTAKLQRITTSDLFNLGLVNGKKDLRNFICKKLNLGLCNGKIFLKRLNENNISIEELSKVVEEYKHGNK